MSLERSESIFFPQKNVEFVVTQVYFFVAQTWGTICEVGDGVVISCFFNSLQSNVEYDYTQFFFKNPILYEYEPKKRNP